MRSFPRTGPKAEGVSSCMYQSSPVVYLGKTKETIHTERYLGDLEAAKDRHVPMKSYFW